MTIKPKGLSDWQRRFDCRVERDFMGALLDCCLKDCKIGYQYHCFHCKNFPADKHDAVVD